MKMLRGSVNVMIFTISGQFYVPKLLCQSGLEVQNQKFSRRERAHRFIENFSNGFLFLQGTHSTVNDEFKWKDDFKGEVFYSHSKSDSCGVSICFIFSKRLFIRNKLSDNDGSILILNVDTDDENFILICITPAPKLSS